MTKINHYEHRIYINLFLWVSSLLGDTKGSGCLLDSVTYVHQRGMDFNMQHRTYSYRRREGSVVIVELLLLITRLWYVHFQTANNYSTSNTCTDINTKTLYSLRNREVCYIITTLSDSPIDYQCSFNKRLRRKEVTLQHLILIAGCLKKDLCVIFWASSLSNNSILQSFIHHWIKKKLFKINSKDVKGAFKFKIHFLLWIPTQCDPTTTIIEAYFAPSHFFTLILLQLRNLTPDIICKFQYLRLCVCKYMQFSRCAAENIMFF